MSVSGVVSGDVYTQARGHAKKLKSCYQILDSLIISQRCNILCRTNTHTLSFISFVIGLLQNIFKDKMHFSRTLLSMSSGFVSFIEQLERTHRAQFIKSRCVSMNGKVNFHPSCKSNNPNLSIMSHSWSTDI